MGKEELFEESKERRKREDEEVESALGKTDLPRNPHYKTREVPNELAEKYILATKLAAAGDHEGYKRILAEIKEREKEKREIAKTATKQKVVPPLKETPSHSWSADWEKNHEEEEELFVGKTGPDLSSEQK